MSTQLRAVQMVALSWVAAAGLWAQDWNEPIREALGTLGLIEGACYDAEEQSVVLLGNGTHPEVSPSPEQVAVAFRWAFAEEPGDPFVSIDPVPEDPEGPYMKLRIDDISKDTRFGWVMFEADRLLKGYSLGKDNLSHIPMESGVPGYRNIFGWSEVRRGARSGTPVWSRFWFRPARTDVQADEKAMRILSCRMGVETEIMFLRKGKLESSGGKQDPAADAFAEHFTKNYQAFAAEEPVFLELEQQCRLLLVSEWIRDLRERSLPVNLAWITGLSAPSFPIPAFTPSLRVKRTREYQEGNQIVTEMAQLFGGVDLKVKPQRLPVSGGFQNWKAALTPVQTAKPGKAMRFPLGEKEAVAAALPGRSAQGAESKPLRILSTRLPDGTTHSLALRPHQTGRNLVADGSGRELALPVLHSYRPNGRRTADGKTGFSRLTSIEGKPETELEVREYELTSPEGKRIGWFSQHEINQASGSFVVQPRLEVEPGWVLAQDPLNKGVMVAVHNGQRRWAFSTPGGELVAEWKGDTLCKYGYNERGTLKRIETGDGHPVLEFEHSQGGARLAGVKTGDGQRVDLGGSPRSELRNLPEEIPLKVSIGGNEMRVAFRAGDQSKLKFASEAEARSLAASLLQSREEQISRCFAESGAGAHHLGIVEAGGYTLMVTGAEIRILPDSIHGLKRAARRGLRPGPDSEWTKAVGAFVAEMKSSSKPALVVSDRLDIAEDFGGLVSALLQSSSGESRVFVGDNLTEALPKIRALSQDVREWQPPQAQVYLLSDTMREQQGAEGVFRSYANGPYDAANVLPSSQAKVWFPVYHSLAGIEQILVSNAEFFKGKTVVCLGCKPGGDVRAADLAKALKDAGAACVVNVPTYFHAGAAKAVMEAQKAVLERGGPNRDVFKFLDEVLQEARKKVAPDAAQRDEILRSLDALEGAVKKPTVMRRVPWVPMG